MDMKVLTNVKLLPITNPNYDIKESASQLIDLLKKDKIVVIDNQQNILGVTDPKSIFYEFEGFIFGSVMISDQFVSNNYIWNNAELILDNYLHIDRIASICFEKISQEGY